MDSAVTEIMTVDRAWEDAITHADASALDELAASDLIYTHASGVVEDKTAFIDHIMNGHRRFPRVDYEAVEVRMHGTAAVLTCALHLQTVDREGDRSELHFRVTHVWVVRDGRWRLLANQSTHLAETATKGWRWGSTE